MLAEECWLWLLFCVHIQFVGFDKDNGVGQYSIVCLSDWFIRAYTVKVRCMRSHNESAYAVIELIR